MDPLAANDGNRGIVAEGRSAARSLTASQARDTAKTLYADAGFTIRTMQSLRPFICPFDALVDVVPQGSRLLDIGCGAGLFLALLAYTGRLAEGIGYDIDAKSLDVARRMHARLEEHHPVRMHFVLGQPGDELPGGTFDVVSMIDVLHHVPPAAQEAAVRAAAARVRAGGLLIYKDIGARPYWRAAANRLHDLLVAKQWIHYCPSRNVERWAQDEGLKLVHAASYYMLCYHHELRVFERPSSQP